MIRHLHIRSFWHVIQKPVLTVGLVFYLICMVIAAAPPSPFTILCARFLKPSFSYFGLYNNYGVFSPDPANYNQTFSAVVHFADGSRKNWLFPHLSQWSGDDFQKFRKLPYEEWQYYFMWDPNFARHAMWEDAARYVARLHANVKNQPITVSLYRTFSPIIPPTSPEVAVARTQKLMDYQVAAKDLQ